MNNGDPKILLSVNEFLAQQRLDSTVSEEQHCTKLTIKSQGNIASISVFNSGKIVIGGVDSKLKRLFEEMKTNILEVSLVPGQVFSYEIEKFPTLIRERISNCDSVILAFYDEAVKCYKSDSVLGSAFMLGAASEKAIFLLIQSYADSIVDDPKKVKFASRINNKMISVRWDEFIASYKSCLSKPSDGILSQDLETIIGSMFQYCRITRNQIGHPQVVPDLDKGVILVNLSHFITYIQRIYGLIIHFESTGVKM